MVYKLTLGTPIETESVIEEFAEYQNIPSYLTLSTKESFCLSCLMQPDDIVYGLGETVRGINKRGWLYKSDCRDEKDHFEDKSSLYCAHNFLIVDGAAPFGLYLDYPGMITFDIGYTRQDTLSISCHESNLVLYLIEEDTAAAIVKRFRIMTGPSYIAPKWAFGYQQSRWGYGSEQDIREVAQKYRLAGIPLDSIGLDIDYMDNYKDFTVDTAKFPDFAGLVSELKADGIRLVPIIDAAVKSEAGYSVYDEGIENGYFCKREDHTVFGAGVWPGLSHFPDMLNKAARTWFGSKYEFLTAQGIEGFWNDMNEPAIFYSEEGLQEAWDKVEEYRSKDLDVLTFFELEGLFAGAANNPHDYTRFYHNMDGHTIRHDKVHNLYGYQMTRASCEGLQALFPNKRFLLFSRSSFIGMHRFGGTWTGDNKAWWSHILMNLKMLPSLNMCGFLFAGADIGGFACNTTRDLMLRWIALGVFTPLMRNHARSKTRDKECYRFENTQDFAHLLRVRYSLLPYLYSEYMKASLNNDMMFRPLAFDYPQDPTARHIEDQLMLGDGLMIAPIYEQNARGRLVYLPENMLFIKFKSDTVYTTEVLQKGCHYIPVELTEIPVFVKENHLLLFGESADCIDRLKSERMTVFGYVTSTAQYLLYEDDGFTTSYTAPENYVRCSAVSQDGDILLSCNVKGKTLYYSQLNVMMPGSKGHTMHACMRLDDFGTR